MEANVIYPWDNSTRARVEVVCAYASVGEICGVMRTVFGDYRAPTAV